MKAIIKNLICSTLYYTGILNLFLKFSFSKKVNLPVVILMYHRITENIANEINQELTMNHPLENFSKEMRFIKKYFNIVPLDTAVELIKNNKAPCRPTLAITFDDGFEDNYRLAFPVLKELDLSATIFLTSGVIGTDDLPWVEAVGESLLYTQEKKLQLNSSFENRVFNLKNIQSKRESCNKITAQLKEIDYYERIKLVDEIIKTTGGHKSSKRRMLNWQEVREMSKNNITFGPHTTTHPILSKMPAELAKKEISDSKTIIEGKLGISLKHFAFPNGRTEDFNEELKDYCKAIGFESVSTALYGNNQLGSTDVFALKRLSPGKNMPIFAFDLIRGFLRHCEGAKRRSNLKHES